MLGQLLVKLPAMENISGIGTCNNQRLKVCAAQLQKDTVQTVQIATQDQGTKQHLTNSSVTTYLHGRGVRIDRDGRTQKRTDHQTPKHTHTHTQATHRQKTRTNSRRKESIHRRVSRDVRLHAKGLGFKKI